METTLLSGNVVKPLKNIQKMAFSFICVLLASCQGTFSSTNNPSTSEALTTTTIGGGGNNNSSQDPGVFLDNSSFSFSSDKSIIQEGDISNYLIVPKSQVVVPTKLKYTLKDSSVTITAPTLLGLPDVEASPQYLSGEIDVLPGVPALLGFDFKNDYEVEGEEKFIIEITEFGGTPVTGARIEQRVVDRSVAFNKPNISLAGSYIFQSNGLTPYHSTIVTHVGGSGVIDKLTIYRSKCAYVANSVKIFNDDLGTARFGAVFTAPSTCAPSTMKIEGVFYNDERFFGPERKLSLTMNGVNLAEKVDLLLQ